MYWDVGCCSGFTLGGSNLSGRVRVRLCNEEPWADREKGAHAAEKRAPLCCQTVLVAARHRSPSMTVFGRQPGSCSCHPHPATIPRSFSPPPKSHIHLQRPLCASRGRGLTRTTGHSARAMTHELCVFSSRPAADRGRPGNGPAMYHPHPVVVPICRVSPVQR